MPAIFGYYFQYLAYVMLSMLIVTLCPVILTLNRKGVRERTMCSSLTSANYSRQTALGASILVFSIWLLFMIVAIIWGRTLNVKFWLACLNSFVYIIAAAGIAMIIAQFDLSDNGITAISNIIGLGMSFLCAAGIAHRRRSCSGKIVPCILVHQGQQYAFRHERWSIQHKGISHLHWYRGTVCDSVFRCGCSAC